MPEGSNVGAGPTLYVCRDCGDGVEDPEDRSSCPACGGRLIDSTVPHDD